MEYDTNGYLSQRNYLFPETYSYLYKNKYGNTIEVAIVSDNNILTRMVLQTMEYLPNSNNTTGYENIGITYLGKQDKELITTVNNTQGNPLTYKYEYDSSSRVSKAIVSNGKSYLYTYY